MVSTKSIMIPTEMFDMFAPVLYVSRIFCLQPLYWKKTDFNYVLSKSAAYIAYSILTVIFFVISSIFGLTRVYQIDVIYLARFGDHTARYVTFSDISVVLIPTIFAAVTTSMKLDKYMMYFDHLRKFDSLLQKHPSRSRKYLFVTVMTMSCTSIILVIDMIFWIMTTYHKESIYVLFGYFFPYYICYCFTMVEELLYWQCVHSIKVRIILLNGILYEAVGDENLDNLFTKIDRKKISNIVDTMKVDELKKQLNNKKLLKLDQIQSLINAYQKLTEATNSINDCYGLVILIVILGCLIHLLVTPYTLYRIMFSTGNSMFIVSQSIWMTGHVIRLMLIVEPCHGCLIENKNTAAIVCKLLCFDLEKDVKKSLEFLLQYVTQCKIEFTAFGMTKIHRGLLTTIAGAVTTYLVILFQFNK